MEYCKYATPFSRDYIDDTIRLLRPITLLLSKVRRKSVWSTPLPMREVCCMAFSVICFCILSQRIGTVRVVTCGHLNLSADRFPHIFLLAILLLKYIFGLFYQFFQILWPKWKEIERHYTQLHNTVQRQSFILKICNFT